MCVVEVVDFLQGAAVEGADDVVAAVGDEGAVFGLAVFGGVAPLDVFAEAAPEEEDDHGDAYDKAHQVVDAVVAVFVAPDEDDFASEVEGEEDEEESEEGGVPVVDKEMGPEAAHVAADAEVLEYLAGEAAVGVLVVGGVADVADDDEEDGDVVEQNFGDAMVVFVPPEFERQQVGHEVGEEDAADGGNAEDNVAPDDSHPFLEGVDVEDAGVVKIEECLCGKEEKQGQQGFAK